MKKSTSWPVSQTPTSSRCFNSEPQINQDLERTINKLNKSFFERYLEEMQQPKYSYSVERSKRGFKCQLRYIDENQIVQVTVDLRVVTKLVEMILKKLLIEDGVLSLRCELRGTNCEAYISLISNKDTVNVI